MKEKEEQQLISAMRGLKALRENAYVFKDDTGLIENTEKLKKSIATIMSLLPDEERKRLAEEYPDEITFWNMESI